MSKLPWSSDPKVDPCCCEGACSLYPAFPVLVDSNVGFVQWTADTDNLPASIDFYGTTLYKSGTSYGNTTNGVILEGEKWAVYLDGARTERDYLISGGIADFFGPSYTVVWTDDSDDRTYTVTVTRSSCGAWGGAFTPDGCPAGGVILRLGDNGWDVVAISLLPGGMAACYLFGAMKYPDSPESSPAGSYGGTFTVS